MIITGIVLYWVIGQVVLGAWYTQDLDLDLLTALIHALVGWLVWPFFAIAIVWRKLEIPDIDDIIIWKRNP